MKVTIASLAIVISFLIGILLFRTSSGVGQQRAEVPTLFSIGYQAGHELAGFSGRPMVLVFGDSRMAGWNDFLLQCESNLKVAFLLSDRFQGVFVDAATEEDAFDTYGNPSPGTVLLKDLHGPIRGMLSGKFSCLDILGLMEETLPFLGVEPSPAYTRLLVGTDLLDELVTNNDSKEAARMIRLLEHFEPGKEWTEAAKAKARVLNVAF